MEAQAHHPPAINHHFPDPETGTACAACGSAKRRSPSSSSRHHGIPLPATSPAIPNLRRSNSDPVPLLLNPPQPQDNSPPAGSAALVTPSPARAGPSAARGLCRSVSAPENELIAATDRSGESPNSKRLKRMKDRMREMSQWCDHVITEVDEDEGEDHLAGAEVLNSEAPKDDEIEGSESEEEALSVEKNGECLIIHMKCPCSKAYQFLLSGNNCYYKLM